MKELIVLAEAKRKAEGLNDYAFARKIGVSRQMWSIAKQGKIAISPVVISAIVRAYPEFANLALGIMVAESIKCFK